MLDPGWGPNMQMTRPLGSVVVLIPCGLEALRRLCLYLRVGTGSEAVSTAFPAQDLDLLLRRAPGPLGCTFQGRAAQL
jgi:hypothetical protein